MKIILASTSPRRIQFMKEIGLPCEVLSPNIDETPKPKEKPAQLVSRLARQKAKSVAERPFAKKHRTLVIAADTIVVEPTGKKILNKPASTEEAARMLKMLSGKTHTVLTGYCIHEIDGKVVTRVIRSQVTFRKLSPKQIQDYIATKEPMDKAGAYGAQGLGMVLIEKINGSYANVVGLPVAQLWMDLEKNFGLKAFSNEL